MEVTPNHQAGTVAGRWWSPRCPHGHAARGGGRGEEFEKAGDRAHGRSRRWQLGRRVTARAAQAAAAQNLGGGTGGGSGRRLHATAPSPPAAHAAAGKHKRGSAGLAQTPATLLWLGHAGTHGIHALGRVGQAAGALRRGTQGTCGTWPADGGPAGRAPGRVNEHGGAGRVTRVPPREGAAGGFFADPRGGGGCRRLGPPSCTDWMRVRPLDSTPPRAAANNLPPPRPNGGEAQTPNPRATTPRLLVSAGAQPMGVLGRGGVPAVPDSSRRGAVTGWRLATQSDRGARGHCR